MKTKLIYFAALLLALVACKFGKPAVATLQFNRDTINFGTINKGDSITVNFEFKNSGEGPLKIINVEPSCECSVVNYPTQAFEKNSSGEISVKYNNSKDRFDTAITKILVVRTNCHPSLHTLTLQGKVRVPGDQGTTYKLISITK